MSSTLFKDTIKERMKHDTENKNWAYLFLCFLNQSMAIPPPIKNKPENKSNTVSNKTKKTQTKQKKQECLTQQKKGKMEYFW